MSYTQDLAVDGQFDDVRASVESALADEGFGVLTEVDVQATFDEKLDADFRRYDILGACAPPLAQEALDAELQLGALLPCNVIVYERDDGAVGVSAVDPAALLSVVDNPDLDPVVEEVTERFDRVFEQLEAATTEAA
jgi:uncharacterized protein (DUF302 family)